LRERLRDREREREERERAQWPSLVRGEDVCDLMVESLLNTVSVGSSHKPQNAL
jgi:hypothetical protein